MGQKSHESQKNDFFDVFDIFLAAANLGGSTLMKIKGEVHFLCF